MTLNDLERQNRFYGFLWRFRAATQVTQAYIIHKVAPQNYRYRYAIQLENLVFVYKLSVNTPIFS